MTAKLFVYSLLCINLLMLGACGVKPPYVEPPEGAEHSEFPRVYPDVNTDPKPGMEQKQKH